MKLKEILKALQDGVKLQMLLTSFNTWRTCDVGPTLWEITGRLGDGVDLDDEVNFIRVKPAPKILIGGKYYEVPEPIRLEPNTGDKVWSGNTTLNCVVPRMYDHGDPTHRRLFHSGLLYASTEQALLSLPMEKAFYNERTRLIDSCRD